MTKFIAIDQGTTSTRAVLFDESLNVLKIETEKLDTQFPNSGWVEQDPLKIVNSVIDTVKKLIDEDVVGLGITNQRETVVLWNRETGIPIYNAIVWQDRRTASICNDLKTLGYDQLVKERTGLLLDPYFSATKISWMLDNVKNARQDAEDGRLAFGTIDSFILWHLTDGKVHATDVTNASRTMLFNIFENKWDDEMLNLFNIPRPLLPIVKENIADFSETSSFGRKIPIKVMIGDQQAAAVGQGCLRSGMVKATFGTGCFALLNTGVNAKRSESNLITTIAFQVNGFKTYAIEGSLFNVGTVIDWIKDNMNFINDYKDLDNLSFKDIEKNSVIFIPAFTGLGAPYWNSECRGAIFGLERDTNVDDLVKAALKSVAFQVRDLLSAMQFDYSNQRIEVLKVDGGVSQNNWLMQELSSQIGIKVERPINVEASALGVAFLIGLSTGQFSELSDINKTIEMDRIFTPSGNTLITNKDYSRWTDAVRKLLN